MFLRFPLVHVLLRFPLGPSSSPFFLLMFFMFSYVLSLSVSFSLSMSMSMSNLKISKSGFLEVHPQALLHKSATELNPAFVKGRSSQS